MTQHRDPVTGDALTRGEYVSWLIQSVIRRWTFLILILIVTVVCWITRDASVLLWWNLSASLLAILIEAIVGKGMFGQTRRDAVILRHVEAMAEHLEKQDQVMLKTLLKLGSQEDLIVQLIKSQEN